MLKWTLITTNHQHLFVLLTPQRLVLDLLCITKRQKNSMNMQSYGKKYHETNGNKVFLFKYIVIKNNWLFVKLSSENIERFILYLWLFHFFATGRCWKRVQTSGNSSWFFQDGGTFLSKLLTFKTLLAFVILTLLKLLSLGPAFFSVVQTSCQHSFYVQGFLKFPMWVPPFPMWSSSALA